MNEFTRLAPNVKRIAESTVRRLSIYLRFLEEFEVRGATTVSSEELARRGGTTSAQVRKDLSFFGSFGKRGLGYSVPELSEKLREILGLGKQWNVCIIGAGKIGAALARYRGFAERGFTVTAVYDSDPAKIGKRWESLTVVWSLRGMSSSVTPDLSRQLVIAHTDELGMPQQAIACPLHEPHFHGVR